MVNLTGVGVLLPIKMAGKWVGWGEPAAYSTITLHMRMEIEAVTAAIMAGVSTGHIHCDTLEVSEHVVQDRKIYAKKVGCSFGKISDKKYYVDLLSG